MCCRRFVSSRQRFAFPRGQDAYRHHAHALQQVGEALAHFHRATHDFNLKRGNALSVAGWEKLVDSCIDQADTVAPGLAQLIISELGYLKKNWPASVALPQGVIHADLFPDNVLFNGKKLYGLIDFYFACNDTLAYDLAICVNSWCFEDDKVFPTTAWKR